MKGVSEVIAIILILMIVIALSALAYTWFSGIFASMTASAGTAVTTTTNAMTTQFRIEGAKFYSANNYINVTIRNIGSQTIKGLAATTLAAYVSGKPASVNNVWFTAPMDLGIGGVAQFSVSATVCTPSVTTVSITVPTGLTDTRMVVC